MAERGTELGPLLHRPLGSRYALSRRASWAGPLVRDGGHGLGQGQLGLLAPLGGGTGRAAQQVVADGAGLQSGGGVGFHRGLGGTAEEAPDAPQLVTLEAERNGPMRLPETEENRQSGTKRAEKKEIQQEHKDGRRVPARRISKEN